jgi:hypothetical protein
LVLRFSAHSFGQFLCDRQIRSHSTLLITLYQKRCNPPQLIVIYAIGRRSFFMQGRAIRRLQKIVIIELSFPGKIPRDIVTAKDGGHIICSVVSVFHWIVICSTNSTD